MSRQRRDVLKAAGAIGAGSLLTAGTVAATGEECTETVQEVHRDEVIVPVVEESAPVGVATQAGALRYYTEPFTLDDDVFEQSDLEENRLYMDLEWNPTDEGPSNFYMELERRNFGGSWEVIGESEQHSDPVAENRLEFVVTDGGTHVDDANNAADTEQRNDVIVEGGYDYRVAVWHDRGVSMIDLSIEAQAYDPECFDDGK